MQKVEGTMVMARMGMGMCNYKTPESVNDLGSRAANRKERPRQVALIML